MKSKYLSFVKNAAITAAVVVGSGVLASCISREFTDNGKIIGAISTAAQYLFGIPVFLFLHARDNRDVYTKDGRFDWKSFMLDQAKFTGSLLLLDAAYLCGRPFLQDGFVREGITPEKASLLADSIAITAYASLSVPCAKLTGIIRGKKSDLEEKTSG